MPDALMPLAMRDVHSRIPPPVPRADESALRQSATGLEAAFLAEMLGHAGVGKPPESFGGGAGEQQFGSYLTRAYAEALADRGGIGLAESLFEAMKARQ